MCNSALMQQRPGKAYTFCCVERRDAWSLLCAPVEVAYNSCAAAERCHHCSYSSSADCNVSLSTDQQYHRAVQLKLLVGQCG